MAARAPARALASSVGVPRTPWIAANVTSRDAQPCPSNPSVELPEGLRVQVFVHGLERRDSPFDIGLAAAVASACDWRLSPEPASP